MRTSKRSGFTRVELFVVTAIVVILCAVLLTAEPIIVLLFGWVGFLQRVVPRLHFNPSLAIQAVVATILIVVLAHSILKWLGAHVWNESEKAVEPKEGTTTPAEGTTQAESPQPEAATPPWQLRWTLAGLAVVMLMFIAGISMTGAIHQVGWLASSEEPIIRSGGREAFLRMSSQNNLRKIALAVLMYDSTHSQLPAGGTFNQFGEMQHGWQSTLLPYMERDHFSVDRSVSWDHPNNRKTFQTVIPEFLNPSFRNTPETDADGYALTHYATNSRVMGGREPLALDQITDGLSNTLLTGEVNHDFLPWGHPRNWRDPAKGIHRERGGFGSTPQQHGAQFGLVDGSVRFISEDIDPEVLRALATPAGDEPISVDDID